MKGNENDCGQAHRPDMPRSDGQEPLQWNSSDLLRGQREVLIRHGGEVYRLQTTQLGKLILTK